MSATGKLTISFTKPILPPSIKSSDGEKSAARLLRDSEDFKYEIRDVVKLEVKDADVEEDIDKSIKEVTFEQVDD